MSKTTGSQRDAASVLFNLSGYRVLEAVDGSTGDRQVLICAKAEEAACPNCGELSLRVHSRRVQRLKDLAVGGPGLLIRLVKRRFKCVDTRCRTTTFTERTDQVPLGARVSTRLRESVRDAVVSSGRAVSEVAASHGIGWWTVQKTVNAAAAVLDEQAVTLPTVRRLGIDEHRYRSVRFYRNETGTWSRYEPWRSTLVDLDTGCVLGVVDGRGSAGIGVWLAAREQAWRDGVEVVAIDPSAAFRKALRVHLPHAAVSIDKFHLVKLANDALTAVRRRICREQNGRRGRKEDGVWAHRLLLLRGGDTLSARGLARLKRLFATDDPTNEISAAWAVKEQLRRLLATSSLTDAEAEMDILREYVRLAAIGETDRLLATIEAWWPQIEVLIVTGTTNARTEAANTSIKQLKRTGRGYRNPEHYRARILLTSAARTAA